MARKRPAAGVSPQVSDRSAARIRRAGEFLPGWADTGRAGAVPLVGAVSGGRAVYGPVYEPVYGPPRATPPYAPVTRVSRMSDGADPLAEVAGLPGVAPALDEAREAVDRVLGQRLLWRRGAEVSAESALRGARASAAIEGAPAGLDEIRSGAVRDPVVQGALRVSAEAGPLADTWKRAPRQALARLHALAATDAVDADRLGRPRADLAVLDPLELGPPPPPEVVAARLDALMALLAAPTRAPALAVAAVVHGELLTLRPFGWGDGIVARAAHRLVLVERGLDAKAIVMPEVGHLELGGAYGEALRAYAGGTPQGVATWIGHCAEAVSLGAREALAVCTALARG